MTEILDKLSRARYISTIDLNKAYHQISLSEKSKPKTVFIIPGKGLYQYRRMPFGLTGAPGTFQRLIDKVLISNLLIKKELCNYFVQSIACIIKTLFCNVDLFHGFAVKKSQNLPIFVCF